MIRTHKTTGWTRQATGYGHFIITPTDGSGTRDVVMLSAGSWQNLANDDRSRINEDRVVLVSGNPLPEWAIEWLRKVAVKRFDSGRQAFRAALDDADWHEASRDGW